MSPLALVLAAALAASAPPAAAPGGEAPAAQDGGSPVAAGATSELPQASVLRLRAAVDKTRVTLGEPFTLTIDVVHDPADAFSLPFELARLLGQGDLALRGEPVTQRSPLSDGTRTSFTLALVASRSLHPRVPDLDLQVQGPQGPRRLTVPGQPIAVESLVEREGAPNSEHAHHGPKPPETVWVRSLLWLWLLLGLAALGLGIFGLIRWQRLRALRAAQPPPPPLPHDEAFARLRELRRQAPWSKGDARPSIFEISEIVRTYLGKRLSFPAIDLTSEELVERLRQMRLLGFDLASFAEQLQWEDLVKFARVQPTPDECLAAVAAAEALIARTQELMPKERFPGAPRPHSQAEKPRPPSGGAQGGTARPASPKGLGEGR